MRDGVMVSTKESGSLNIRSNRIPASIISFVVIISILFSVISPVFADTGFNYDILITIGISTDGSTWSSITRPLISGIWNTTTPYMRIEKIQISQPSGASNSVMGQLYFDIRFLGAMRVTSTSNTYNCGYTKSGGDFSNYYLSHSSTPTNASINYTFRSYAFVTSIDGMDFGYYGNTDMPYAFTQSCYMVSGVVSMSDSNTHVWTCSNPPTFHFWNNSTTNFVTLYPAVSAHVTFVPGYNNWFDTINHNILTISHTLDDVLSSLSNLSALGDISQYLESIDSNSSTIADLQQEHQDLTDRVWEKGENAFESQLSDSDDGFDFLDSLDMPDVGYNPAAFQNGISEIGSWFTNDTKNDIDAVPSSRKPDDIYWVYDDWVSEFFNYWR